MRILHVITSIDRGGAECHLLSLVKGLDKTRYDVDVAYMVGNGSLKRDFDESGIKIYNLRMTSRVDPRALYRLIKLIFKNKYRIIHTHGFRPDLYGTVSALISRTPIIISSKHNDEDYFNNMVLAFLHRLVSRFQDRIICISEHVKKFTIQVGVNNHHKVKRIYYGLDWERFDRIKNFRYVRDEFGIKDNDFFIGSVARISPQKGLSFLIKAMRKVIDIRKDVKLVVVGQPRQFVKGDWILKDDLLQMVEELYLKNHIFFAGSRNDIQEVMLSLDLFVLPSLWEGFGLVLLEAMATQKPIVASRVSTIPEIVSDGVTGLLIPPANVEELTGAILRLAENREMACRMGKAGRKRLEDHFGLKRMVKQTETIYEEELSKR
ncbi:MAG: glycosyltransferase [Nitrospirota bacterium]